jgi:urease gamma subunit
MTDNDRIIISLDAEQYRELLGVLDMGLLIRETVFAARAADAKRGEGSHDLADIKESLAGLVSLERAILEPALGTDADDLVQEAGKRLLPADDIMDGTEEIIDEYVEDQFWLELSDRLGQRDFLENVSEEDLDADTSDGEGGGLLPEGVRAYYAKYDKEFDKHGLERLRVEGK